MKRGKPIPQVPEHPLGRDDPFDTGDKDVHKLVNVGGISGKQLLSFIERIERLDSERAAIAEDIREVRKEAKGVGFDLKVISHILKLRKQDSDDRDEFEMLVDTYMRAIGDA